jgi:peptide chain release factor 1
MTETQDNLILQKLEQLDERCRQIEQQITDPAVASNPARLVPLTKEQGKLAPIVHRFRQYRQLEARLEEARRLLAEPGTDGELKELAESEAEELQEKKAALLEEIKNVLVMSDDAAVGSIIMELRAGTGGEEAALFVRDLYNMYQRYADKMGWKVEMMDFSPTDRGGFRELIMNIKGPGVWSHLGYEGGGHRVQRVPETESQGRIHTSAATVAVLPEAEEVDIDIKAEDVIEHVSCAGGPGGQNVNKVATAIRLEHIPTGIVVSMRDERSQHKNRAKAWRVLRSRVYEYYQKKAHQERSQARKSMIGSGDRSERIRTYNFPQNRLTDHRINLSLYCLDKIMLGDMDELIRALQDYDRQRRLETL